MKTSFVSDLNSEQSITAFFLVHEKEIRNTREGKQYLRLELGDRSGTIEARMWDHFDVVVKDISRSFLFSSFGSQSLRRSTWPTFFRTPRKTSANSMLSSWNTPARLGIPGSRSW